MKELDPLVFFAVFEEMLGPLLWILLGLAAGGIALLLFVLLRERTIVLRRFIIGEVMGFIGAVSAVLLMWNVTNSGWSDLGGPIDWLLLAGVFAAGWAGALVLYYGLAGLVARRAYT